eukprot:Em0008g58a
MPIAGPKWPLLNEGLFSWFSRASTPDGKLVLSNGWLAHWKGRHGVFSVRLHGEAGGADQQGISRARAELPQIIGRYQPEDVLTKLGCFIDKHLMAPSQPLLMCVVQTKLRTVFSDWTKQVNAEFKRQKHSCLMILDNATSHAVADVSQTNVGSLTAFKLSNLLLLFLPANCTNVIQPLDQGIIAAFKSRYKIKLARHMVSQFDVDPTQNLRMVPLKVKLKQAILRLRAAWNEITVSTMVNCWCKADILPEEWNHRLRPDRAAVVVAEAAEEAQMTAIASAIEHLPVEDGQLD